MTDNLVNNIEFVWKGFNENKRIILSALKEYRQDIQRFDKNNPDLIKIKKALKFVRKTLFKGFESEVEL